MKRHIVTFTAAAFLALGASSAWAQRDQPADPSGGRGVGGGEARSGGDTAAPATSSGSTSSGGSASTGGSSAVSSGSTGGGGNAIGWGGRPGVDFPRAEAPRRGPGYAAYGEAGQGRAVPRGSGGGGDQGRAAPRGESGNGGESRPMPRGEGRAAPRDPGSGGERRAVPRGEGGASGPGPAAITQEGGGRESAERPRSAVPAYSRPREGRTPIGSAAERGDAIGRGGVIVSNPWSYYGSYWGYPYGRFGYYNRYGWYPGYGFGLGYFYDPFWSPGYYGYGGYYGGGYGGGSGYYRSRGYDTGSLRLKVQPRDAKVYVDGYFVGVVDSFDGVFQKLAVEAGTHRVEIRADGYEPVQFEVMVTPGETITYKGQLKRLEP